MIRKLLALPAVALLTAMMLVVRALLVVIAAQRAALRAAMLASAFVGFFVLERAWDILSWEVEVVTWSVGKRTDREATP